MPCVDTTYDFLEWYESLCDINVKADDGPYEAYYKQLEDRRNECVSLTDQVRFTQHCGLSKCNLVAGSHFVPETML